VGRLTPTLRQLRVDPRDCHRVITAPRAAGRSTLHQVTISARYAGRSCYLRPLFDRPRQWAAQRTPRSTPTIQK
jgi:hypothetical protein